MAPLCKSKSPWAQPARCGNTVVGTLGFDFGRSQARLTAVCELWFALIPCWQPGSYPSYRSPWQFCGTGIWQASDQGALSSLKAAAQAAGHPEWGNGELLARLAQVRTYSDPRCDVMFHQALPTTLATTTLTSPSPLASGLITLTKTTTHLVRSLVCAAPWCHCLCLICPTHSL